MGLEPPAGRLDLAVLLQLDVVQHQRAVGVEHRLVGRADDERAVEPALELHRLVEVRVVPEGARVRQAEAVGEGLARTDGALDHLGPVHGRRNPEPMPVHHGRLGKAVGEADLEHVSHGGFEGGTRDRSVEAPGAGGDPRHEFPVDLASLHLDRHDLVSRVGLRCGVGLGVAAARSSPVEEAASVWWRWSVMEYPPISQPWTGAWQVTSAAEALLQRGVRDCALGEAEGAVIGHAASASRASPLVFQHERHAHRARNSEIFPFSTLTFCSAIQAPRTLLSVLWARRMPVAMASSKLLGDEETIRSLSRRTWQASFGARY